MTVPGWAELAERLVNVGCARAVNAKHKKESARHFMSSDVPSQKLACRRCVARRRYSWYALQAPKNKPSTIMLSVGIPEVTGKLGSGGLARRGHETPSHGGTEVPAATRHRKP